MTPVQRLIPLALALLSTFAADAHAGGSLGGPVGGPLSGEPAFSATATLASQYVWRGIRRSDGRPAAQLGVNAANPDGWSAGAWLSSLGNRNADGWLEWDVYGGYSGKRGDLGYKLMAYYYGYPGALAAAGARRGYGELVAGLNYKTAYATSINATYYRTVTRDFSGIANARGTGYVDVGVRHAIDKATTLNLHAGDGRVAGGNGNDAYNWRDVKAGLNHKLDSGWALAASYSRAYGGDGMVNLERGTIAMPRGELRTIPDAKNSKGSRGAVVLSLARTF